MLRTEVAGSPPVAASNAVGSQGEQHCYSPFETLRRMVLGQTCIEQVGRRKYACYLSLFSWESMASSFSMCCASR